MNPAASVIAFTTLSGAGFGLLALLALRLPAPAGLAAFAHWTLAYALASGGLLASVAHLARPARARFAFSQWRSSWLSREGIFACAALIAAAPLALADSLAARPAWTGLPAALLAALTVLATAMIYAQLRAVPRWNMALTPVLLLTQAAAGGTLLAGFGRAAAVLLLALTAVQLAHWHRGDRRFAAVGASLSSALGLPPQAAPRLFERSHTARDWVLDEMAFRVARKHRRRLRPLGLILLGPLPAALALVGTVTALALAAGLHLLGALACRWLFFAEAEHTVGLYYGRPAPQNRQRG